MTDQDETIRTSVFREMALALARVWAQHIRPVSYDRVFYVDGVRVRISIDEYSGRQHGEKPLEIMYSERSVDA